VSKPTKRLALVRSEYSGDRHEKKWLGWKRETWSWMKRSYHKRERAAVRDLLRDEASEQFEQDLRGWHDSPLSYREDAV
jgi:hypothetical protein